MKFEKMIRDMLNKFTSSNNGSHSQDNNEAPESEQQLLSIDTMELPQVKITDTFLQDIARLIPENEDGEGCEFIFRKWIKVVKNYYPKDCTDSFTWLMTSWILFVEYANSIWVTASENKKQVVWKLVDRFDQAFDKFKNKTMKKAV